MLQAGMTVVRGEVSRVHDDRVYVRAEGDAREWPCVVLCTSDAHALRCAPGDHVVFVAGNGDTGIVLGRVGAPQREYVPDVPDELTLEAASQLSLKCGEGSITIRADGKILIKGKNLVSLALETNRIKGGSVAIN
jgi:hypothetical protein